MKRIMDGRTYNTDTSSIVARYGFNDANGYDNEVTVYQTRGGAFFRVYEWGQGREAWCRFEPMDRDDLAHLVDEDNLEIVDEVALQLPPEAVAEVRPEATVYVRVPAALKQRLDESAKSEGQSANTYALRCFERCLGLDAVAASLSKAAWLLGSLSYVLNNEPSQINAKAMSGVCSDALDQIEYAAKAVGVADLIPHISAASALERPAESPYTNGTGR